jgi:peptide-methionine (S)-S-oxide reductase
MKKYFLLIAILFSTYTPASYAQVSASEWTNPDTLENVEPPALTFDESNDIDIELIDSELKQRNAREDSLKRTKKQPNITSDKHKASVIEITEADENLSPNFETATFAGGCFWCMEQPFDDIEGVISTTSGYTGGETKNPTYEEVSSGKTGHYEAVQLVFDPNKVSFAELLKVYWKNIDPMNGDGQFCDIGTQYKPAIFYHDEGQKAAIYESLQHIAELGFQQSLKVDTQQLKTFYPAEEYHQDYYKKNPLLYNVYKQRCGREKRLHEVWRGKDFEKKLQNNLQ